MTKNYYFPEDGDPFEVDHLALSDAHGQYIPIMFCSAYPQENISNWAWETCLKGPGNEVREIDPDLTLAEKLINAWRDFIRYADFWNWRCYENCYTFVEHNEHYWDAWTEILDCWVSTGVDKKGRQVLYRLFQDGDLWVTREVQESITQPK